MRRSSAVSSPPKGAGCVPTIVLVLYELMRVQIDTASSQPLYVQVAAQIRASIAQGDLCEGDALPRATDLADALGVNMHTILRAYADLRDEGILDVRRRRGAVVRTSGSGRARLVDLARQLADEGARQGLSRRGGRAPFGGVVWAGAGGRALSSGGR